MKKIVLTFGLLSGGILATMATIMMPLCMNGTIDFDHTEILGYTIMVLSFLLVFFGIRSYRENVGGGVVTFGKAFQVGILMSLITGAVYVISWEIVYYNFLPDFEDRYSAHMIDRVRARGATEPAIEEKKKEMARFKELYKNPFIKVGMTFLEAFPVGLIVTVVSAAILRRRTPGATPSSAAAAAS
jgi:ethanolamine transporter EutH